MVGVDTVYGIAGTFREPNLTDDRYREVNVEAVRLMMEAAKRHGVRRVIHCSTVGIHGNVVGPPASETTPLRPDGIYEITKAEGDQLALSYARRRRRDRSDPARTRLRPRRHQAGQALSARRPQSG